MIYLILNFCWGRITRAASSNAIWNITTEREHTSASKRILQTTVLSSLHAWVGSSADPWSADYIADITAKLPDPMDRASPTDGLVPRVLLQAA